MRTEPDLPSLVRRARGGDTMAMAELLDALTPYVGRICGAIALSSGPDAAQETLLAVFRNLRTLHEPAAVRGWVRAIAVREAVRAARRDARTPPVEHTDRPSPGDIELGTDIRDTLSRLTPEHRAVLVLRHVDGLDEHQVAALLAVPPGTVKSRLHRARASFRNAWNGGRA